MILLKVPGSIGSNPILYIYLKLWGGRERPLYNTLSCKYPDSYRCLDS